MNSNKETKSNISPFSFASIEPWLYLILLIFFVGVFVLFPLCGTVVNSFFRDVTFLPKNFVWVNNYIHLFNDAGFRQSLIFTLLFVAVSVPLEIAIGLIFALLLNEITKLKSVFRAAVLLPWAIPVVISGRIWELIYNYNYGLANSILKMLGLTQQPVNWFGTPWNAFRAVVIADVWKTTPFVSIILLTGLTSIPLHLYNQAKIDGANLITRFFRITMPLLKPVLIIALIFRTIDALRIFDVIFVLTRGGPGGTTTSVSLYGYNFFLSGDFGYGATVSVILFVISLVLSVIYIKAGKFRVV